MASLHGATDFTSATLFEERLMKAFCGYMTERYAVPWLDIYEEFMNEFPHEYQGLTPDMLPTIMKRITTNRENNTTSNITSAAGIMGTGVVNQMTTGNGGISAGTAPFRMNLASQAPPVSAPTPSFQAAVNHILEEYHQKVSENEKPIQKSNEIINGLARLEAETEALTAAPQEEPSTTFPTFAPVSAPAPSFRVSENEKSFQASIQESNRIQDKEVQKSNEIKNAADSWLAGIKALAAAPRDQEEPPTNSPSFAPRSTNHPTNRSTFAPPHTYGSAFAHPPTNGSEPRFAPRCPTNGSEPRFAPRGSNFAPRPTNPSAFARRPTNG